MYPESLKKLIESLKFFPGIGEKSAERMAFAYLEFDKEQVEYLIDSMQETKAKIHPCPNCLSLTDQDVCDICSSPARDHNVLCVVEDPKIVFLFEKLGTYKGMYHVIKGLISPLEDINPEDIGLEKLLDRIKKEKFTEIILAFKPSVEGEITALYIKQILDGLDVEVSRLASGVPMGADMEYIDSLTLERALNDRKKIS